MSRALNSAEGVLLKKLLAMLGSEYPGERDNAARLANKLVTETIGWSAVAERLTVPAYPPLSARAVSPRPVTPMRPHERKASSLLACADFLSGWERSFLLSIKSQRTLSTAQAEKLASILRAVQERKAA